MFIRIWWLLAVGCCLVFISHTNANLPIEFHGLDEVLLTSYIPDGIKSQLKEFNQDFKDTKKNFFDEHLTETQKNALINLLIEVYGSAQAFVISLLSFDINNAMHLPEIDTNLADLVKLMKEIKHLPFTGDPQTFKLVLSKLKQAKYNSDQIFSMLKNAIDRAIIDNFWVFVGTNLVGTGIGAAISTFFRGLGHATEGGLVGFCFSFMLASVSFARNANRIDSEAELRLAQLKIVINDAKSTAEQWSILYPEEKCMTKLINDMEELENKVINYKPGEIVIADEKNRRI